MKTGKRQPGPNEPVLDQKKIADKLKELRIQSGYTQMEIAQKLEVTVAYVSSIENGRSKLNLRTLLCYSELCHVPSEVFISAGRSTGTSSAFETPEDIRIRYTLLEYTPEEKQKILFMIKLWKNIS